MVRDNLRPLSSIFPFSLSVYTLNDFEEHQSETTAEHLLKHAKVLVMQTTERIAPSSIRELTRNCPPKQVV